MMGPSRWRFTLYVIVIGLALCWWLVSAVRGELPLAAALAGTMLFFSQRLFMEPPRKSPGAADAAAAVASGVLPRWYLELRLLEETRRHQREQRPMVIACFRSAALRRRRDLAERLLPHVALAGRLDDETLTACLTRCDLQQAIPVLRAIMAELEDAGWQVGISVLPDDGHDSQKLLQLALRRLMPWRVRPEKASIAVA